METMAKKVTALLPSRCGWSRSDRLVQIMEGLQRHMWDLRVDGTDLEGKYK